MWKASISTTLIALLIFLPSVYGEEGMKTRASISGTNLQIVLAALPEVKKHNLDIKAYQIDVLDGGSNWTVYFRDPERPAGIRGGSPNIQEWAIDLTKDDLRVMKTYLIR